MKERVIIKLGGSLLSPNEASQNSIRNLQIPFDFEYAENLITQLKDSNRQFILVVGGGYINRWYVNQLKERKLYTPDVVNDFHTIGMASSELNGSILRILLSNILGVNKVFKRVVKYGDYDNLQKLKPEIGASQFVVAGGWKTGHSHDVDALMFASLFASNQVISLKNIDGIYTADPNKDPSAVKKKILTWPEYRSIIKVTEHEPRASFPIDAVAANLAEKSKIGFTVIDGRDFVAVKEAIDTKLSQYGSTVVPE